MNNIKLYCCGQVGGSGELNNILELVKLKDYFDGLSWTVNYAKEDFSDDDGTYEVLLNNKNNGKILRSNWVNINSLGMTMAIQSGVIKDGDWILMIDSQELPKEDFLKNLRNSILQWEKDGIYSVWWGRPYIFKFSLDMTFQPTSVHCMVNPIRGKYISIQDESKVVYDSGGVHFGDFIYNKKKFTNSMLLHGVKYSLFNVSNQFNMFYSNSEEYTQHETYRRLFIKHLDSLGYDRSLIGLEKFMKSKDFTEEIKKYFNYEWVFKDYYRYCILNHSIEDIMKNRMEFIII